MDISDQVCTASLKLLGDFWTLRIINALEAGELRFSDLQRAVGNCNPVTFTDRLKKMEDAGLLNRAEETKDKISVSYSLTDLGYEALRVVAAIDKFAEKAKTTA